MKILTIFVLVLTITVFIVCWHASGPLAAVVGTGAFLALIAPVVLVIFVAILLSKFFK